MTQPGEYVIVYDQIGFHQATSTAELLAEKGCTVEIVTPQFFVGGDLSITLDIELWYRRALTKGMRLTPNHFLAGLGPNSATIINNYTGQPCLLENIALAVIVAPQAANDTLYPALPEAVRASYGRAQWEANFDRLGQYGRDANAYWSGFGLDCCCDEGRALHCLDVFGRQLICALNGLHPQAVLAFADGELAKAA